MATINMRIIVFTLQVQLYYHLVQSSSSWNYHRPTVLQSDHSRGIRGVKRVRLADYAKQTMETDEARASSDLKGGFLEDQTLSNIVYNNSNQVHITKTQQGIATQRADATTQVGDTTTKEDDLTTQEHDFTTDDPDYTTQEPDITTQEPDYTTQESDITTQEPDLTTQDPYFKTDEPDITTHEPDSTTQEPDITTNEPNITTQEPDLTTEEPDITTKEPDYSTQEASLTTQEPDFSSQEALISRIADLNHHSNELNLKETNRSVQSYISSTELSKNIEDEISKDNDDPKYEAQTPVQEQEHSTQEVTTIKIAYSSSAVHVLPKKGNLYGHTHRGHGDRKYVKNYVASHDNYHKKTVLKVIPRIGNIAETHIVATPKVDYDADLSKVQTYAGHEHNDIRESTEEFDKGSKQKNTQDTTPYRGPLAMLILLQSGYLADTEEVLAARAQHFEALRIAAKRANYDENKYDV